MKLNQVYVQCTLHCTPFSWKCTVLCCILYNVHYTVHRSVESVPYCAVYCTTVLYPEPGSLRQSLVMKPSFVNPVSWMGSDSFVDINIFAKKYYFMYSFFTFSSCFLISQIKIYANVYTPRSKIGNFVQRYSLKFPAQRLRYPILKPFYLNLV